MKLSGCLKAITISFFLVLCLQAEEQVQAASYSYGDGQSKNAACMACHAEQSKVGQKNYIDPTAFGHSTHAQFGCSTCHDAITAAHPNGQSVTRSTSCADCHGDIITQYSASIHGSKAPCSGCHNPHSVFSPGEISGEQMNKQCAACHTKSKITASHAKWLPQAGLHLGAIACVTCHSKAENYVITIYIANRFGSDNESKTNLASFKELSRKAEGEDKIHQLIDKNKDNYISLGELKAFNSNRENKDLYLKAMLTPVNPTHSFQTFDNRWDCTFCHASGPEGIMQVSYMVFPEADGTYRQVAVEKGAVMDALQAMPDFYLMGSTRNSLLNKVGLLVIMGGMIMPVGHGFFRFLSRKNRP